MKRHVVLNQKVEVCSDCTLTALSDYFYIRWMDANLELIFVLNILWKAMIEKLFFQRVESTQ